MPNERSLNGATKAKAIEEVFFMIDVM